MEPLFEIRFIAHNKCWPNTCEKRVLVQDGPWLLLLVFYVQYAIRFLKYYFQEVSMNRQMVWGLAAFSASVGYLVCGFFYDSSLQCTPFFCVLMGIGLSVTKNTEKREEIKHRKKQI